MIQQLSITLRNFSDIKWVLCIKTLVTLFVKDKTKTKYPKIRWACNPVTTQQNTQSLFKVICTMNFNFMGYLYIVIL